MPLLAQHSARMSLTTSYRFNKPLRLTLPDSCEVVPRKGIRSEGENYVGQRPFFGQQTLVKHPQRTEGLKEKKQHDEYKGGSVFWDPRSQRIPNSKDCTRDDQYN